ncbi:SIMPL domain-containing protein [Mesorhizobium xinjiangense]|uniref:SIMPL domain-containing protein n=1 Tax=Mesorhizobium xinjiangense TaxID=2678685 RepID=UPI0012EE0BAB|nr:SIMPL domain-containing protein [Mesorhizobium xinjiangense]
MFRAIAPYLMTAAIAAAPLPALAQNGGAEPSLSVSGEGEMALAPDMATLTLAVMRQAPSAREAMTANNKAMSDVIAAMKASGIADRDLQTSGISIQPRYEHRKNDQGGQTAEIVAYEVSNTLTVRVRELEKVGEILDKSVTLGVNQGGGISFGNDDPSAALTEARKRAVADAIAKARTLAEAAGVELGRIVNMSEHSSMPRPVPYAAVKMAADRMESAPVEGGENTYQVQVNVTFEIGQ